MLIIFLACCAGILAGIFTGLMPGIHINLVSVIIISALGTVTEYSFALAAFIVTMAVTHTFVDFIPSIYLGAPEEDTFLAVLPGHQLLKEGNGHEAVLRTVYGGLFALIITIPLVPLFVMIAPPLQEAIGGAIPIILIAFSCYMILREEKIIAAFAVFVLAGMLGWLSFHLPVKEPLLPLLTGLFGMSAMIVSINDKITVAPQNIKKAKIRLEKKEVGITALSSLIVTPIFSLLPALGSGYSALVSAEIWKQSPRNFLLMVGTTNMLVMILSFAAIYSIGKARTGAAAAIEILLGKVTANHLMVLIIIAILGGIIAAVLTSLISRKCAHLIAKANYRNISLGVMVLLMLSTIIFSNALGLVVLVTAASIGIFAIKSGIKRTHLMGSLIIPTVLIYLVTRTI